MLFTLLVRFVILPFDVKSRKSMRKTQQLQPQIAALQKKYKNDKDKLNQKTAELYRKEKINPLSGCWPMLLTMPILFAMFGAMRGIANEQIVMHAFTYLEEQAPVFEGWLWVKNIWMPDSPFATVVPDLNSIQQIGADVWQNVWNALDPARRDNLLAVAEANGFTLGTFTAKTIKETVASMYATIQQMPAYANEVSTVPGLEINLIVTTLKIYKDYNGLFILPIMAAVTQFLMTILNPQATAQAAPSADGKPAAGGMGGFMKWFFPIFSLFICSSYNAGFSLYWVTANIIAAIQNIVLNKYLDAKERKISTVEEGTVK